MTDKSTWTYLEKLIDHALTCRCDLLSAKAGLGSANDDEFEEAWKYHQNAEIEHRVARRRIKLYVHETAKTELED